jgi:hypothetical protein
MHEKREEDTGTNMNDQNAHLHTTESRVCATTFSDANTFAGARAAAVGVLAGPPSVWGQDFWLPRRVGLRLAVPRGDRELGQWGIGGGRMSVG